jgi:hypothetical protein
MFKTYHWWINYVGAKFIFFLEEIILNAGFLLWCSNSCWLSYQPRWVHWRGVSLNIHWIIPRMWCKSAFHFGTIFHDLSAQNQQRPKVSVVRCLRSWSLCMFQELFQCRNLQSYCFLLESYQKHTLHQYLDRVYWHQQLLKGQMLHLNRVLLYKYEHFCKVGADSILSSRL